ncbi:helix-turn-helix transcriptional regulator [Escherichia coli]|nr:helix-turn-helix transcriptional regulator [Escherichia coli]MCN8704999.1 helix-turn-helix transcriptional regulator [Escherichia coli]
MGLDVIMRSKTLQQSVLSDLLLWIDNNLDKKLTVDDLSDISGYSPWHLFRLFRHYFDSSPMEYIRQQRMSLCRSLLLTKPGDRIVDICMMVGYDDISVFNRTFKRYHALTPTQYRHLVTRQKEGRFPTSASLQLGMERR